MGINQIKPYIFFSNIPNNLIINFKINKSVLRVITIFSPINTIKLNNHKLNPINTNILVMILSYILSKVKTNYPAFIR